MKKTVLLLLAMVSLLTFVPPPSNLANQHISVAYAKDADHTKAKLTNIFPYIGVRSLGDLGLKVMDYMGRIIILASVLGIMIGGGFWVLSNGDEGMVSQGKNVMFASVIGLTVTMLSYAIVMLVQSLLYSVGS
jgi:hypothetical protein